MTKRKFIKRILPYYQSMWEVEVKKVNGKWEIEDLQGSWMNKTIDTFKELCEYIECLVRNEGDSYDYEYLKIKNGKKWNGRHYER